MWRVNINGTLHCGRPKKILSLQFFAAAEKSQEANELYFYLAKAIKGALSSQNHHCFGLCCNNYLSIHCSKSKDSLTCISKFSPISSGSAKHDGECKTPLHTVFSLNGLKRIECSKVFPVWQVWPWPSGRGHSPRQPTDCETLQNQIANCKNTNLGLQTRTLVLVLEISAHTASNFQSCGKPSLIVTHAAKTGLRLGHRSSYQLTSLQSLQNAKCFQPKLNVINK